MPYDIWIEQGYCRTCPGNKINPHCVTEWFLEVQEKLDIYIFAIGYDAWSTSYWISEMQDTFGKEQMIAIHQGKKTLSQPMQALGADLTAKKIIYNNNPIDKWCLCNTAVDEDKNGNIQPIKTEKATRRIDGTAALLDAYVVFQDKIGEYESVI